MFNLIPISLLITAIGGMVYIISNHLSEFNGDNERNDGFNFNLKAHFAYWINQLPLDSVKSQSLFLTQKLLHKTRLLLLKTDNHLMKLIGKISEKDKTPTMPDFWQDLSNNKQEKEEIIPKPVSEVKIEFASEKDKQIEKFFDPVRNQAPKASVDALAHRTSNGVDIQPAKKTLKIKKSLK